MLIKCWRIRGGLTMEACFTGKEGGNRAKLGVRLRNRLRTTPVRRCLYSAQISKTAHAALTIEPRRRGAIDDLAFRCTDQVKGVVFEGQRPLPGRGLADLLDSGGSIGHVKPQVDRPMPLGRTERGRRAYAVFSVPAIRSGWRPPGGSDDSRAWVASVAIRDLRTWGRGRQYGTGSDSQRHCFGRSYRVPPCRDDTRGLPCRSPSGSWPSFWPRPIKGR